MQAHTLENTFFSEPSSLLLKVLLLLKIFAHLLKVQIDISVPHTEKHASCLAFLKMTASGWYASRKLGIWPVITNYTISLSSFCVTVHLQILLHYGCSSGTKYVMISDMHYSIAISDNVQPRRKCLTMAFIL